MLESVYSVTAPDGRDPPDRAARAVGEPQRAVRTRGDVEGVGDPRTRVAVHGRAGRSEQTAPDRDRERERRRERDRAHAARSVHRRIPSPLPPGEIRPNCSCAEPASQRGRSARRTNDLPCTAAPQGRSPRRRRSGSFAVHRTRHGRAKFWVPWCDVVFADRAVDDRPRCWPRSTKRTEVRRGAGSSRGSSRSPVLRPPLARLVVPRVGARDELWHVRRIVPRVRCVARGRGAGWVDKVPGRGVVPGREPVGDDRSGCRLQCAAPERLRFLAVRRHAALRLHARWLAFHGVRAGELGGDGEVHAGSSAEPTPDRDSPRPQAAPVQQAGAVPGDAQEGVHARQAGEGVPRGERQVAEGPGSPLADRRRLDAGQDAHLDHLRRRVRPQPFLLRRRGLGVRRLQLEDQEVLTTAVRRLQAEDERFPPGRPTPVRLARHRSPQGDVLLVCVL